MIEFFVKRPVTTIMFVLVFVVLGAVSYTNLAVESTPKIDFPIVAITASYPGATPLEVETLVINKIEDAVSELSEIKKVNSTSYEGYGVVTVEFLLSSDVNVKFIEVKDKVEAIVNDLPSDVESPVIEKFDPLIAPVLYMVATSETKDDRFLYEFADKQLKNQFSKIEGVANVDIVGGRERRINIYLDPMLMKQYYITINEVVDKIDLKNKNIPGGTIDKVNTTLNVRFLGEFVDVAEIENMIISSSDGTQFKLKDIAIVEDASKDIESIARFNSKNCVALSINKVSDGNAVDIARRITKRLPSIRETLPDGVQLEIATDTTKFIVDETKDARFNIILGILLTIAVLYLFTGRVKLTFIGSIIIPSSIISTFFLMDVSDFSFNMMTLLAIAVSLGTLIANAIVIIESVLMHLERGKSAQAAAIDGTKEVTSAVIASAGTNLVVFTPIAFMGGIVGQFFLSFGLTVVYATIFSLIASFTLTPMLCAMLMSEVKEEDQQQTKKSYNPFQFLYHLTDRIFLYIEQRYEVFFEWMFKFPKTVLLLVALSFYLTIKILIPFIGNEFYPQSDQDQITVYITMPQGTKIEKTLEVVKKVETRVSLVPERVSYFSNVGNGGEEEASVSFELVPSKTRARSDMDIINALIPDLAKIPDAHIVCARTGDMGEPGQGDVSINVYGIDYDVMIRLSREMKKIMEESGYFRSVTSSYKEPKDEIQFIPQQEKLMEVGIENTDVGDAIRFSVYGNDTNVFKEDGEEYDINVELLEDYKGSISDIEQIGIISRKGLIPVTELGELKIDKAIPPIKHRDRNRVITLEGFLSKSNLGYMQTYLNDQFKDLDMSEGYGYNFSGDSENQEESNAEIAKAFLLAIILTFMILAAILNSFIYPVPSFLLILLSFIGVFFSLFFLNESLNIASMLGMIMLVGLVINDAILVIDYALLKLKEGMDIIPAIKQGATIKFRAIVLTTIAVILGTLPQLRSVMPLKTSMGAVIIGGMAAACVLTFVYVPIGFWYAERFNRFIKRTFSRIKK